MSFCFTNGHNIKIADAAHVYDVGNVVGKEMWERGLLLERRSVVLFDLTGIISGGRCLE